LAGEPFLGSIVPVLWHGVGNWMRIMTGQLIETPRDDFMVDAERELVAFERWERELRKQDRLERAKEKFPTSLREVQS
jgi:hypothetical protein